MKLKDPGWLLPKKTYFNGPVLSLKCFLFDYKKHRLYLQAGTGFIVSGGHIEKSLFGALEDTEEEDILLEYKDFSKEQVFLFGIGIHYAILKKYILDLSWRQFYIDSKASFPLWSISIQKMI